MGGSYEEGHQHAHNQKSRPNERQSLGGIISGGPQGAMNNDSSQDSLAVQSPNLLRKKFAAKQQQ